MELDVSQAVLLGAGEGESITERAERTVRLLLAHELLDVTWSRYEPGEEGPEPHVHREHVDSFFVLEGELAFGLGPDVEEVLAPAGTFVSVPQNVAHTFKNTSDRRACFLNFHAPSGGFADFLRERSDGFDSFDPPEDGGGPASAAVVSPPGAGERMVREDRVNLIKSELPEISAFQLAVEPAWDGVGTHQHEDHVDTFFVLEGETELVLGGGVRRAGAGSFYGAIPGTPHGIRNDPGQRAVLLNVHAPDLGFAAAVRRG